MFQGLGSTSATDAIPPPATLSLILNNIVDNSSTSSSPISQTDATKFATAAVEMWHRAVHSFLISASLTKASPIWSSVSGYYSSHYSIRAFAHLFGHFLLYKNNKCRIELELDGNHYLCHIKPKGNKGEHRYYWKIVHEHPDLIDDSFFTINNEYISESDSAHRNKANYYDHLNGFQPFQVLDETYLKHRIAVISNIEIDEAPIPNCDASPYPDLENVQIVAYHRLVKFRNFIDSILGGTNRFWSVHRNPSWCPNYMHFQLVKSENSNETLRGKRG